MPEADSHQYKATQRNAAWLFFWVRCLYWDDGDRKSWCRQQFPRCRRPALVVIPSCRLLSNTPPCIVSLVLLSWVKKSAPGGGGEGADPIFPGSVLLKLTVSPSSTQFGDIGSAYSEFAIIVAIGFWNPYAKPESGENLVLVWRLLIHWMVVVYEIKILGIHLQYQNNAQWHI
jgi:hypothetical protein